MYDSVRDRLVLGENVAQAAQFVQSGAADAGVFSRSLALAPALRDAGSFWEVPEDAHPRLELVGLLVEVVRRGEVQRRLRRLHVLDAAVEDLLELRLESLHFAKHRELGRGS